MKKLLISFTEIRIQPFISKLTLAAVLVLSIIGQANAQASDLTPLEISDFSFTPTNIDTTDSSQRVIVTIRAASPGAGVSSVIVRFQSLTGNQFVSVSMDSGSRISGDRNDGVYSAAAIFPQYSKAGEWNVFEIDVFSSGNYKIFYNSDLAARGFATGLQVISNNEDIIPPEISDFSFTPSAIDTTNGAQSVTVTVRATDEKAGVRAIYVNFLRPNDDEVYGVSMDGRNRISGDEKDGIYRAVITFNRYAASGIYDVSVYASDALFNRKSLSASELAGRGFASQLRVNVATATLAVLIGGRVLTANGQGVSRAVVTLTEPNGNIRYAATNAFGYYRFDQVKVGETYTFQAKHKRYAFASQVLSVNEASNSLNFIAKEIMQLK